MKNLFVKMGLILVVILFFLPSVGLSAEVRITASSIEDDLVVPENVLDGNMQSRWSSNFSDREWLKIDLGETKEISGLTIFWEDAYAASYEVQTSIDEESWKTVYKQNQGKGGYEDIEFEKVKARYIKLLFNKRATKWGYSIFEISIDGIDSDYMDEKDTGEIISLDGKWNFKLDPENTGVKNKWFSKDFSSEGWEEIGLGMPWEDQGFPGYDGYTWYKKDIFIPENWNEGKAAIMMGGVDDAYDLYINGRHVASFGSMSCESTSIHQTLTTSSISKYIIPGKPNNFTFRVFDFWGTGGITKDPLILVQNSDCIDLLKKRLDAQSYYQIKAKPSQKKYYPNWVGGYQAYWTVVGVEGDITESTFCEDGMIQMYNRGPSLMPFIYLNGELLSYADFKLSQSLEKDYLPMPTVTWESDDLIFTQKLFAHGKAGESFTCIRYILKNKSSKKLAGKLFLTIRPFQVNPSWQWGGGMAKIKSLEYDTDNKRIIKINGREQLIALEIPDEFGALGYMQGDIVDEIKTGKITTPGLLVNDPFGYASGALEYNFELAPGKQQEYFFIVPLHDKKKTLAKIFKEITSLEDFNKKQKEVTGYWEKKLNQVRIEIPNVKMANTVRSSLAYIFINRDGPMLQAGSGAYEKSWIRDACITSSALLRMGYTEEVREYLDWITNHIKRNGKVPPIMVAEDNPDPAWESIYEEYDSQGQYIYAVLQYYLFTKDKEWLRNKLPTVMRVLDFMEDLRKQRLTDEYRDGPLEKRKFYGIFPESVSHEGYFPPPGVHSYWDDFWGLKGWRDARTIAEALGENELLPRIDKETEDFGKGLYDSIKSVQDLKNLNYIPGCAERGDFDAPSIAIAVWPTGEAKHLPQVSLYNTFDIFWTEQFSPSLKTTSKWSFPLYALRISQVFTLFDQRDKAIRMLEQYMKLHRPLAWNQWAEGTLSDDRKPWFIGDLPHSWLASIYINSFRSLFVYEKDGQLLLGGGIPPKWISDKEAISIENFPTYYGNLSYTIGKENETLQVKVSGNAKPPNGFILKLKLPQGEEIKEVNLNGKKWTEFSDSCIIFYKLPANIVVTGGKTERKEKAQ